MTKYKFCIKNDITPWNCLVLKKYNENDECRKCRRYKKILQKILHKNENKVELSKYWLDKIWDL